MAAWDRPLLRARDSDGRKYNTKEKRKMGKRYKYPDIRCCWLMEMKAVSLSDNYPCQKRQYDGSNRVGTVKVDAFRNPCGETSESYLSARSRIPRLVTVQQEGL